MTKIRNDEFQRAVREADEAHRAAMPGFREMVKRYLSPDSRQRNDLDLQSKAVLLGAPVPSRRRFMTVAVGGVAGAAFLAACSDDDSDVAETGEGGTGTTAAEGSGEPNETDNTLATAAIEIENTAVAAYDAVLDAAGRGAISGEVPDAAAAAATLFRDHHDQHRGILNSVLPESIPADQFSQAEGAALPETVDGLTIVQIATFARGLEDAAAQTYVKATPLLSLPALRQQLIAIGGAEARHVTAFDILLGGGPGGYTDIAGGSYPIDGALF